MSCQGSCSKSRLLDEATEKIALLEMEIEVMRGLLTTDPLTEVLNRRGIDERLSTAFARYLRTGKHFCFAVIDLDNFKRINDVNGHKYGDMVLHNFASLAKHHVRTDDSVGRFGGEEFIIIFPETQLTAAQKICERLLKEARNQHVTFSCGVTEVQELDNQASILERADALMYSIKTGDKNGVAAG